MEITDIRIRRIESEGKMKAVVSVTFDNEFVVHDIKIIESQSGLFIAMPSRKTPSGEFRDIAHPIHSEARTSIQSAILERYNTMLIEEETTGAGANSSETEED
ncbi:MAG: septation regulator SpoVG [Ruminiclostridium sp.]|nr:septation regulator SpoVG [Ruminiclostridium sp.]